MDITTTDGRRIRAHESGARDGRLVLWLPGAGTRGDLAAPLPRLATTHGLRLMSFDRPGYGGSEPAPVRTIAEAVADTVAVLDALEVERVDVVGLGAGAIHGLALAAVAPQRVAGVTALSTPAPLDAEGLDWFAGAGPLPTGETRAAMEGREALVTFLDQPHEFDITMFHLKDIQAMRGPWWEWQQKVADPSGTEGVVGDDLALVAPWGFDLAAITTPVRLVHGEHDTFVPVAHARWLADRIPGARLEAVPGGGISTIARVEDALARVNG